MMDGFIYPLLVIIAGLPGWLAYTHPVQFKRLTRVPGGIFIVAWIALGILLAGVETGFIIAKERLNDPETRAAVAKVGALQERAASLKNWAVFGGAAIIAYFSFLFVSVTKWKNSPDHEEE